MGTVLRTKLCDICLSLDLLGGRYLPSEDEDAIPHQPDLVALERSAKTCSLCQQILLAASLALTEQGGMTSMYSATINGKTVTVATRNGNYPVFDGIPRGLFRGMNHGGCAKGAFDTVEPDFSEQLPISAVHQVDDPLAVRPYLFASWWQSADKRDETKKLLIGLGVRLGTSPSLLDAVRGARNKAEDYQLRGTFIRFRTLYDSVYSDIIPGRMRNGDLSSKRGTGQVRQWLERCNERHSCVQRNSKHDIEPPLPTRVLELEGDGSGLLRLSDSRGRTGRYVALSHCWGSSHRLTTTNDNLHVLMSGIQLDDLPRTFKDAIHVCLDLGIYFLWIDSLCIVQDDPAEWSVEAENMGAVYSNAYLTISALHALSDDGGCFPVVGALCKPFASPDVICTARPTFPDSIPLLMPKETESGKGDLFIGEPAAFSAHGTGDHQFFLTMEWMPSSWTRHEQIYHTATLGPNMDPLASGPLNTRGWVLQERLLSNRTIHYEAGQMFWECQNDVWAEDGSLMDRDFPVLLDLKKSMVKAIVVLQRSEEESARYKSISPTDAWLKLVEAYSRRALTRDTDKLPAIGGLAKVLGTFLPDGYAAGIWYGNFFGGLCWTRKRVVPAHQCDSEECGAALPPPTISQLTYPSSSRAPSWSWAAVDGEISFLHTDLTAKHRERPRAQVVNVSTTFKTAQPYGHQPSGRLELSTWIAELLPSDAPGESFWGPASWYVSAQIVEIAPTNLTSVGQQAQMQYVADATSYRGWAAASAPQPRPPLHQPKPKGLRRLFSRSSDSSKTPAYEVRFGSRASTNHDTSSRSLAATQERRSHGLASILFDVQSTFPCYAAVLYKDVAMVLTRAGQVYRRVGLAFGPDIERLLVTQPRQNVVIV